LIPKSLRFRLLGGAVAVILITVQIAGIVLLGSFNSNVLRLVHSELDNTLTQLATFLSRDENGNPRLVDDLADEQFRRRYSGRYWQISANGKSLLRSRSLGDAQLDAEPLPSFENGAWRQRLVGPDKQNLYAAVRRVILEPAAPGQPRADYVLIAAMDVAEIRALDALNGQLRGDVLAALGVLSLLLIAAAWLQVSFGLRPLELLRKGLENIRVGKVRRLSTEVPSEVRPLVEETNRLLEAQEKTIDAARARAGDLAHGLKTPLTVLSVMVKRLRDEHKTELATELDQHLKGLTRHVERELRRSRIAATLGLNTFVAPIVGRLLRTMEKLPRGDHIEWSLDCSLDLAAPVEEEDLTEVLGNLLDNARKWARSEVHITGRLRTNKVELLIEDDGPGVPEADRALVMRRGTRLDETVPGSGLGLGIVKAIVEAYGGEIDLANSARGGLSVRLSLPQAVRRAIDSKTASQGPSHRSDLL
jgi:signal transduction histidine kinase